MLLFGVEKHRDTLDDPVLVVAENGEEGISGNESSEFHVGEQIEEVASAIEVFADGLIVDVESNGPVVH